MGLLEQQATIKKLAEELAGAQQPPLILAHATGAQRVNPSLELACNISAMETNLADVVGSGSPCSLTVFCVFSESCLTISPRW